MCNIDNLIRINKAISLSGYASRRKADELIKSGKVKVNGKVIFNMGLKVSLEKDEICINNEKVSKKEYIYLLFNKPAGCITTASDEKNRKTIYEILPSKYKSLKFAGRLDRETEGLMVLSNDGDFINEIIHPKKEIKKTYIVSLSNSLDRNKISDIKSKLLKGVMLDGRAMRADSVKELGLNSTYKGKPCRFEIVIHEGVNRQIRRMFQTIGFTVTSLVRVKIGSFNLSQLEKNKSRYLEIDRSQAYAIFK